MPEFCGLLDKILFAISHGPRCLTMILYVTLTHGSEFYIKSKSGRNLCCADKWHYLREFCKTLGENIFVLSFSFARFIALLVNMNIPLFRLKMNFIWQVWWAETPLIAVWWSLCGWCKYTYMSLLVSTYWSMEFIFKDVRHCWKIMTRLMEIAYM